MSKTCSMDAHTMNTVASARWRPEQILKRYQTRLGVKLKDLRK